MPQSLVKNFIHITFSTKHRQPLLQHDVKHELYNYIGGICLGLETPLLQIGGSDDHIHLLINLSRKIALMAFIEKIKSHSSKWIKTKGDNYLNFYWQHGYGGFSVNPTEIDRVIDYIKNQEIHHKKYSFFN